MPLDGRQKMEMATCLRSNWFEKLSDDIGRKNKWLFADGLFGCKYPTYFSWKELINYE
jgi:hypothetical protein